jgi:hypothetical protein
MFAVIRSVLLGDDERLIAGFSAVPVFPRIATQGLQYLDSPVVSNPANT